MRVITYTVLSYIMIGTACHSQALNKWKFNNNSAKSKILTCQAIIETPNGPRDGVLIFTRSAGKTYEYSIDFRIANVKSITAFNFDDFEGPDVSAKGNLMTVKVINSVPGSSYTLLPGGGYVSSPTDGFSFGASETGQKNPLFLLIQNASNDRGRLLVQIIDSRNEKNILRAEFNLEGSKEQFGQFLNSN